MTEFCPSGYEAELGMSGCAVLRRSSRRTRMSQIKDEAQGLVDGGELGESHAGEGSRPRD